MFMFPPSSLHETQVIGQWIEKSSEEVAKLKLFILYEDSLRFPWTKLAVHRDGQEPGRKICRRPSRIRPSRSGIGISPESALLRRPSRDPATDREHAARVADGFG